MSESGTRQSIVKPHGITVFGSSIIRVEPDYATLDFQITGSEEKAGPSLQTAQTGASGVRGFLKKIGVPEANFRSSRPNIQEFAGDSAFVGYRATIDFNVTLEDLELVAVAVAGVVDGGARNLKLRYRTSRLNDSRAEAQQAAVLAASRKAELLAEAAGIEVGRVLHVEDVDPNRLEREGDDLSEMDHFQTSGAYNPGAVAVRAAVRVSFSIKGAGTPEVTGTFGSIPT